jgi:hypothetical protein
LLTTVSQIPLDYLFLFCTYVRIPRKEVSMDNRLNKIRKEMNALRADMLRAEGTIRDLVNYDRDCTEAALLLMAMRAKMSALVREWTQLGGIAHLPTVDERLKGRRGDRPGARSPRLPMQGKQVQGKQVQGKQRAEARA